MICPFCDESTLLSEDDMLRHVAQEHPEKTATAEAFGDAMTQALQTVNRTQARLQVASTLVAISVGQGGAPVEDVLERFRYFLRQLYELI